MNNNNSFQDDVNNIKDAARDLKNDARDALENNVPMKKAQHVADEMGKEVDDMIESAKDTWDDISRDVKRKGAMAREGLRRVQRNSDEYARENPWLIAGIAAGVGTLLGVLLGSGSCGCGRRCSRHQ